MNKILLVGLLLALGCQAAPKLEMGQWTGTLSPMNHPEMKNPVHYDVSYDDAQLEIDMIGPNRTIIKTLNPRVKNDTLYFSFAEPEKQVLLNCALGKYQMDGFAGKCIDSTGKWAHFTMRPPANAE